MIIVKMVPMAGETVRMGSNSFIPEIYNIRFVEIITHRQFGHCSWSIIGSVYLQFEI